MSSTSDQLMETQNNEIYFSEYRPGCFSALCAIQSEYYAREWGFGALYESVIGAGVSEFLTRYNSKKDFVKLVMKNKEIIGGIAIDHKDGKTAQLRWFIVSEEARGTGVGQKLFIEAMRFVKSSKFEQVFLTTFEGLDKARSFYEKSGFSLTKSEVASTWGKEVVEQRFDWFA
jgi:GNAT superfamily N-acetyltransferase